jgi:hypothetical protein
MTVILISIVLIALAFAGIAIKILAKKDGKFSGTCSSNNPLFQKMVMYVAFAEQSRRSNVILMGLFDPFF